jgi:hypothetical protein
MAGASALAAAESSSAAIAFQDRYADDGYGENQSECSVVAFGIVQRDHHGTQIVQNDTCQDDCCYKMHSALFAFAISELNHYFLSRY